MKKKKECPECFGEKKIETRPGVFIRCIKCRDQTAIHIRPVTPALKRKFKKWCLDRELHMKDAVIALINLAMENDMNLTEGEE